MDLREHRCYHCGAPAPLTAECDECSAALREETRAQCAVAYKALMLSDAEELLSIPHMGPSMRRKWRRDYRERLADLRVALAAWRAAQDAWSARRAPDPAGSKSSVPETAHQSLGTDPNCLRGTSPEASPSVPSGDGPSVDAEGTVSAAAGGGRSGVLTTCPASVRLPAGHAEEAA